jgi:hypothetical protein
MTKIVLQPCGKGIPAKHYADTVEKPVLLSAIFSFLSQDDLEDLRSKFPEGRVAVWGVTPGEESGNKTKWDRMNPGDVALFSREGRIFSAGTVAKKIHDRKLSRHLWGEDEAGETWEYMYFLKEMRSMDIPYKKFNAAAGYKENNVIQGFNVLPEEKSAAVLLLLGMQFVETVNEKELTKVRKAVAETREFDPQNEAEGRKKTLAAICRRQGQPEFRRKLIEAYSGRCAMSGCDAVQTLEAAHIMPYNGPGTNHPANGLLLRADLHTLFDLGLITIDPATLKVVLAPSLKNTSYAKYEGKIISFPSKENLRPNRLALEKHRANSGL